MRAVCALVTLLAVVVPVRIMAADDTTVTVSVHVASRTSLQVSTRLLQFVVDDPASAATASVDFTAAARVESGEGVVLSVEPLSSVEGPGGAADVDTEVTFSGEGGGTRDGRLSSSAVAIAASWQGSGQRTGRLVFTLHAAAAGVYTIPVRLVLSCP